MKQLAELISSTEAGNILESIHAMIALVDSDGTLVSWNRAFEARIKLFPVTNALADFFAQEDKDQFMSKLAAKAKDHWVGKFPKAINEDEVMGYSDCSLIPISDERMLFIAEEIRSDAALKEVERLSEQLKLRQIENEASKRMARNKQIEIDGIMAQAQEVAQIDALTFLYNRRRIVKELQDEVIRAERYNSILSISVVDVDHFKAVNDTYGHTTGDEVLRKVAQQLRDHIRQPDTVGRYGGEEFLILLPNSDAHAAAEQASRLCKVVRESTIQINHSEQTIQVTISIGVAQFKHGVDTWETLLNRADSAMYEAKKRGRNGWAIAE